MTTIYKYKLKVTNRQTLVLPVRSQLLSFQVQDGGLVLWALVDTEEKSTWEHTFCIYGTGHEVMDPNKLSYIGTAQLEGLVWHLFEKKWLA